jgi:hypothetical protein
VGKEMEGVPENGKESSNSAHANGMNECVVSATRIIGPTLFPDTINSGKYIVQIFRTILFENLSYEKRD